MSGFTMPLEDCSINRNSIYPGTAMHNLSYQKPKPKPVRVDTLLRFYGSDDDESEEKAKSENDSDTEELQSLPEDSDQSFEMNENQPRPNSVPKDHRTNTDQILSSSKSHKQFSGVSVEEKEQYQCTKPCTSNDDHKMETVNDAHSNFEPQIKDSSRSAVFSRSQEEIEFKPNDRLGHLESADSFKDTSHERAVVPVNQPAVNFLRLSIHSDPMLATDSHSSSHESKFGKTKSIFENSRERSGNSENQMVADIPRSTVCDSRSSDIAFASNSHQDLHRTARTCLESTYSKSVAPAPLVSTDAQQLTVYNGKRYSKGNVDPCSNLHKNNEASIEMSETMLIPEDASQRAKTGVSSTTAEFVPPGSSVSHSATETPMKHPPPGSRRPEPSFCHRSIMQTPQTMSHNDVMSNTAQTPATILSHWAYGDMLQTPTQNNISQVKENHQIPGQQIQNPSNPRLETPRYFGKDARGVRRPLAEAMYLSQQMNPHQNGRTYIADPRGQLPHSSHLPKIQEGSCQPKARSSTKENQPVENRERESLPTVQSKVSKLSQCETITVKGTEYLVLGTLGQGMSGKVLRVQNMETGEQRAVKTVDMSRIDKEAAQGSLEEVSLLCKLQAPCVITMFDYEIKSPMLYVVLELGDTDLSRLLKATYQEEGLSLTMILYFWTEMLTAVKHIHDNGVIHQDLKPANFLLVRGRLKLIDFGIASTLNADMTSIVKNSTIGTLNYISPEALKDVGGNGDSPNHDQKYKISYKADVWSLGCILYSMIYGKTPFQHIRTTWAKMNAITNPAQKIMFPPPSGGERGVGLASPPAILVDVIRRCLLRDPKARPTVAQLLEIPYVSGGPAVAPAPKIPPPMLLKIKRALSEDEWRHFTEILEHRGPL